MWQTLLSCLEKPIKRETLLVIERQHFFLFSPYIKPSHTGTRIDHLDGSTQPILDLPSGEDQDRFIVLLLENKSDREEEFQASLHAYHLVLYCFVGESGFLGVDFCGE
jgi:hypothetical protein